MPAVLIPITLSIIKYSADKLPNSPITVILSLSEAIPIEEYLSLYLSVLGVIATVVLAYFINALEAYYRFYHVLSDELLDGINAQCLFAGDVTRSFEYYR